MTAEIDTGETDAGTDAQDRIVYECELDAPPETVWRAVSVPEFLAEWIGFPPREGGDRNGDSASYTIEETTPPSRVRLRWHDRDVDQPDTRVTIDLTPAPEGRTFFRLVHDAGAMRRIAANENGQTLKMAA